MDKKLALIVSVCLLTIVGCRTKGVVVGEWAASESTSSGKMEFVAKFNADGSYSMTWTGGGSSGTYTYNDAKRQITLNQKSMTIGGRVATVNRGQSSGPGRAVDVSWLGEDEFTIQAKDGDIDLKRK